MNKWIAEFELEDGDIMPEHMDLEYKGTRIDFHCRPLEQEPITKDEYHRQNIQAYAHDFGVSVEQAEKELRVECNTEDCISRKDVDKLVWEYLKENTDNHVAFYEHLLDLPSVYPKIEPRKGHWIDDMRLGYHVSICSNCNWRGHGDTCLIYKPKYCPNCGAKMESEKE